MYGLAIAATIAITAWSDRSLARATKPTVMLNFIEARMVTKNSWWKRKLSGKVWVVDVVHDNGPFEVEIRLPESGEREAVLKSYLENHFESEQN